MHYDNSPRPLDALHDCLDVPGQNGAQINELYFSGP